MAELVPVPFVDLITRLYDEVAAQDAELQVHALPTVKTLLDAIDQWRDADALALMCDERLIQPLSS